MIHNEKWLHRAKCGACGAALWIDSKARLVCLCGKSCIEADGTLSGMATGDVTDADIINHIKEDWKEEDATVEEIIESVRK